MPITAEPVKVISTYLSQQSSATRASHSSPRSCSGSFRRCARRVSSLSPRCAHRVAAARRTIARVGCRSARCLSSRRWRSRRCSSSAPGCCYRACDGSAAPTSGFRGIDSRPDVCGGEPCIVRTRIPVWLLEQARRLGTSEQDLLEAYPTLRAEDLVNAWAYVRSHAAEIADQIEANETAA